MAFCCNRASIQGDPLQIPKRSIGICDRSVISMFDSYLSALPWPFQLSTPQKKRGYSAHGAGDDQPPTPSTVAWVVVFPTFVNRDNHPEMSPILMRFDVVNSRISRISRILIRFWSLWPLVSAAWVIRVFCMALGIKASWIHDLSATKLPMGSSHFGTNGPTNPSCEKGGWISEPPAIWVLVLHQYFHARSSSVPGTIHHFFCRSNLKTPEHHRKSIFSSCSALPLWECPLILVHSWAAATVRFPSIGWLAWIYYIQSTLLGPSDFFLIDQQNFRWNIPVRFSENMNPKLVDGFRV